MQTERDLTVEEVLAIAQQPVQLTFHATMPHLLFNKYLIDVRLLLPTLATSLGEEEVQEPFYKIARLLGKGMTLFREYGPLAFKLHKGDGEEAPQEKTIECWNVCRSSQEYREVENLYNQLFAFYRGLLFDRATLASTWGMENIPLAAPLHIFLESKGKTYTYIAKRVDDITHEIVEGESAPKELTATYTVHDVPDVIRENNYDLGALLAHEHLRIQRRSEGGVWYPYLTRDPVQ